MQKRRRYIVDRNFQIKFIISFFSIALVFVLFNSAVLYYVINNRIEEEYFSGHLDFITTGEVFGPLFIKINLISVVTASAIAFFTAFFYTRRIESNLLKFKSSAEKLVQGDLNAAVPPLAMGDVLNNLTKEFNAMAAAIKGNIVNINNYVNMLDSEIRRLDNILKTSDSSDSEIKTAAKGIKDVQSKLRSEISKLKICEV